MNSDILLLSYSITKYCHKNIYSTGSLVSFSRPCIGYLNKGNGQFLYRGKTYHAHRGDLIYIAAGTKYYSLWTGNPDIEFYSISFSFTSNYTYYDYRFQILENYPSELMDKMFGTYQTSPLISTAYFYMLLNDIYKKMIKKSNIFHSVTIEPAIDYIEKNYSEHISIDTLAELCNCSQSAIFKLFQSTVGVTPITYKHNAMIQHALDLISNTDLSIEEISSRTGFSSSNYFRKVFSSITGKSPKQVRKKL